MANFRFDTFLSYSSEDQTFVNRLKNDLTERGITVWVDRDKLLPGDLFVDAIENGLDQSRTICIIISPESKKSGWVKEEYTKAIRIF